MCIYLYVSVVCPQSGLSLFLPFLLPIKPTLLPLNKKNISPSFFPFPFIFSLLLPALRVTLDSSLGGSCDEPKRWCHCCYFQEGWAHWLKPQRSWHPSVREQAAEVASGLTPAFVCTTAGESIWDKLQELSVYLAIFLCVNKCNEY